MAMAFSMEETGSRREFFRAAGRYGLLGLLGVATAVGSRRESFGAKCVNRGICRGCAVFARCGLPQALLAKQFKRDHRL